MQCVYGISQTEWSASQLPRHGMRDGQVGISEKLAQRDLIPLVHGHEQCGGKGFLGENGVPVIVPVNDDFAAPDEGYDEGYVKSWDGGRVLHAWSGGEYSILSTVGSRSEKEQDKTKRKRTERDNIYLNNDPLRSRRSPHHGIEQGPKLLHDLARKIDEKGQRAPGDPFRLRRERIHGHAVIANQVRMSRRFWKKLEGIFIYVEKE